ncbi:hypothetical protein GCM10023213_47160 [Prosthecobacter algae]|uniref:Uncharacterized protein n=1 Tax=Prosthecobacter algae TaxID=1144682 RepID=A0ABP9PNQ3_9BACT
MPPSTNQDNQGIAKSIEYGFRTMGAAASQVNSRPAQFFALFCEVGAAAAAGAAKGTKNSFGAEGMDSKPNSLAFSKEELAEIRVPKNINLGVKPSMHTLFNPVLSNAIKQDRHIGRTI